MDDAEALHFWIRKARGAGVTVTVYNARDGLVATEHAAGTRRELDALGVQYGVSEERWLIDPHARAALDADPA